MQIAELLYYNSDMDDFMLSLFDSRYYQYRNKRNETLLPIRNDLQAIILISIRMKRSTSM